MPTEKSEIALRGDARAIEVKADHKRNAPVVFNPAQDVEDISISIPEPQEEDSHWGQKQRAFVQSARDEQGGVREWTHFIQTSTDLPRRFRVYMIHDHPGKHASEHYTLEYTDYGAFKQNDPELAQKLPSEVYQSMLGISVALREVKLMTLDALRGGEFGKPQRWNEELEWQPAPGIYAVSIAENGIIDSQWELGLSVSKQTPPHYRSFARNVETGEEYGLFASGRNTFEASHAAISRLLPEEVYSAMVGLAVGAQMTRALTLEAHGKGELPFDPEEVNKNRGFCNRLRQERLGRGNGPEGTGAGHLPA